MRWRIVFGALICAGFVAPAPAVAQSADPFQWDRRGFAGQSVRTRPRPELDPLGIHEGSFRFYPSLEIGRRYEDNVFRSPSNEKGALVATFAPKMRLKSEFSNHSIDLTAEAKVHRYATQSAEDRAEFRFAAKGRYDIARDINVSGGASLSRQYERRSSPDQGGSGALTIGWTSSGMSNSCAMSSISGSNATSCGARVLSFRLT